jgi:hypothetical protein
MPSHARRKASGAWGLETCACATDIWSAIDHHSGAPVIVGAENDLHKIKNAARVIFFALPLAADKIRAGDVSGVKNFLAGPAIVL